MPEVRAISPRTAVWAVGAIAVVGAATLGLAGWPASLPALEFGGLLAAVIVAAGLDRHGPVGDTETLPLSFAINLAALLLLGPLAATLVAITGALMTGLRAPWFQVRTRMAIEVAATLSAGIIRSTLTDIFAGLGSISQTVPIASAVLVYCFVACGMTDLVVPLVTRRARTGSCLQNVLRGLPNYGLGASIVIVTVEAIDRQLWGLLPVTLVSLYLAHRSSRTHLARLQHERRRFAVMESLDQGMCAVDRSGVITLWNEELGRLLNCPSELAVGRSVVGAVPTLARTEFPQALQEALVQGRPHTLPGLRLPASDGARILQIKIVPDAAGALLLWNDLTERLRAEVALKQSEDRFSLVEQGVNDGLWEWDVRSQQMYVSGRWCGLLGLPAVSVSTSPEAWLERVHVDDVASLKQAIAAHLAGETSEFRHEHRIRHEDGTYRHVMCRAVAARGGSRRAMRLAGSMTDVTERAQAQERLDATGFRDPLTGLTNRAVFVETLERHLQNFTLRRCGRFAVLYLDLDRFKVVNDSLGHLVGDELLTAAARRLESCLREGDVLARLGGDEFAILLSELGDEGQANAIAFRIQDALGTSFAIGGREVFTSASIGIAFSGHHYTNAEEIMRDADAAMYHAKSRGRARHELFDADMHARALDRLGLESDLRHAVKSSDFEVHYQPIVSLTSGACAGFEALVRWKRNGETIPPDKFIPVAEELGLIEPLGTWVLQQACRRFADWQRRFPAAALECITVNVSTRQLLQQNFVHLVEQAVQRAGLQPSDLRLEITETTLMGNPSTTADTLHELRKFGVKIYLDDFGTGYSSLSHLHKLPVDALKIDRSFVRSLLLPERPAIVESILALARTLETGVVAEGVESDIQAVELARLGCRHAQGFHFSPALSSDDVEALLESGRRLGGVGSRRSPQPARPARDLHPSKPFDWPDRAPAGQAVG